MPHEVLDDFVAYCRAHPEQRFWQALRNWSGYNFIFASMSKDHSVAIAQGEDTFYWKGRDG